MICTTKMLLLFYLIIKSAFGRYKFRQFSQDWGSSEPLHRRQLYNVSAVGKHEIDGFFNSHHQKCNLERLRQSLYRGAPSNWPSINFSKLLTQGHDCLSFEYDAVNQECSIHKEDGQPFGPSILVKADSALSYFQQICVKGYKT